MRGSSGTSELQNRGHTDNDVASVRSTHEDTSKIIDFYDRSGVIRRHQAIIEELHARYDEEIKESLLAIYYSTVKGVFLYGNRSAEVMVGHAHGELIGKSYFSLDIISGAYKLKAAWLLLLNVVGLQTGPDRFMLRRKDGTCLAVTIKTEIETIGGKRIVKGTAQTVSEWSRREKEIGALLSGAIDE